jgi:hypothetical protein
MAGVGEAAREGLVPRRRCGVLQRACRRATLAFAKRYGAVRTGKLGEHAARCCPVRAGKCDWAAAMQPPVIDVIAASLVAATQTR